MFFDKSINACLCLSSSAADKSRRMKNTHTKRESIPSPVSFTKYHQLVYPQKKQALVPPLACHYHCPDKQQDSPT